MIERAGLRAVTRRPVPASAAGWFIELNPDMGSGPVDRGERVVVTPAAEFATNRAVFITLIPSTGDPCNLQTTGALIVVDASTGAAASGEVSGNKPPWGDDYDTAGVLVKDPPTSGSLPISSVVGGGQSVLPGSERFGDQGPAKISNQLWRRRSWRELDGDD
jgi:Tfp pilus tip-associated adhesin PilY1